MAAIRPFRGLRYSAARMGDLSAVTAPPYDVISPEDEETLRARHPCNVIRLILGAAREERPRSDAEYLAAANCLREWTKSGILQRDEEPSFYFCEQEFISSGAKKVRRGFIARVLLEDLKSGSIYAHEQTMAGPKADRLKLMRACRANLSEIFALYPSGSADVGPILDRATNRPPDAEAVDKDGTISRLWRTCDRAILQGLVSAMADKPLFIADGHHRYETALVYRDSDGGGAQGGKADTDYVMMSCVAMDDPGLVIWPTHRLVRGIERGKRANLLERLRGDFEVQPHRGGVEDLVRELARFSDRHAIGLIGDKGALCLLVLRSDEALKSAMPDKTEEWRRLDVSILHSLILDRLLGIALDGLSRNENVGYVKSVMEAEALVLSGQYQVGFLLNPPRIEQVRAIAGAREKMPPKSTYFYPKLLSGLVINPFGD